MSIGKHYNTAHVETPIQEIQSPFSLHLFKRGLLFFIMMGLMCTSCTTTIIGRNGGRSGTTKGKMHTTKEKIHIASISNNKINTI
jgi:hypothetical protein